MIFVRYKKTNFLKRVLLNMINAKKCPSNPPKFYLIQHICKETCTGKVDYFIARTQKFNYYNIWKMFIHIHAITIYCRLKTWQKCMLFINNTKLNLMNIVSQTLLCINRIFYCCRINSFDAYAHLYQVAVIIDFQGAK